MDLSIIVPAYNEQGRLRNSVQDILRELRGRGLEFELIAVDDGSQDQTPQIIEALDAANAEVTGVLIPHAGKGAAVRAGMLRARGAIRLFTDADLAVPANAIAEFYDLAKQHDVLIGSREQIGAKRIGEPFYRHLMGRMFNGLVRFVIGMPIQDTQCGFKAFQGDVAQDLFNAMRTDGWAFDVELLALAKRRRLDIQATPVVWFYREGSKIRPIRDSILMFLEVMMVGMSLLVRREGSRKMTPKSPASKTLKP